MISLIRIYIVPIVISIYSSLDAYSQYENCTYLEDLANYAKAQEFVYTEVDSFKKYISKFISSKNEPCEPYINHFVEELQNGAIQKLAEIEYFEDDHLKTNEYLKQLSNQEREILKLRAKNSYYDINNNKIASKYLLPHIMSFFKIGTDRQLVQFCVKIILEEYDKEYLIDEYHNSILNYSEEGTGHYKYYIQYLGVDILLGIHLPFGTPYPQEQISRYMKNQEFYKLLIE